MSLAFGPSTNPVYFDQRQSRDNLTVYSKQIPEIGWQGQLVGVTDSGFVYVDRRVPKMGYYEFYTAVLPWNEIQEVTTERKVSFIGILLGTGAIFLAFAAFAAVWIKQTHTGLVHVMMPIILGLGGAVLILGPLRNRIIVKTSSRELRWTSGPLAYQSSLPVCREAAEKALVHNVPFVVTHA